MCQLADLGPLDVWYDRVDVDVVLDIARQYRANDLRRQLSLDRVRQRTSLSALPKLTAVVNGRRQILDDPPLIVHEPSVHTEQFDILASYAESLPPDHKLLLGRYSIADTVRKVVGVGSVGTRCYLTLLMDADGQSPIFLQLKEACGALLSAHVGGRLPDGHQGQRIVLGQRLMQAASDPFLGWTSHDGHEYYVRQFRDMKGSVDLAALTARDLASYAVVCGQTLARAHGRAGDPAAIAGYLGRSGRFDDAIRSFASVYADQTERDHAALVNAVRTGRVRVQSDAQEAQV